MKEFPIEELPHLENQIILFKNQHTQLKNEKRKGIIFNEELRIENNLLELLEKNST